MIKRNHAKMEPSRSRRRVRADFSDGPISSNGELLRSRSRWTNASV